MRRWIVAVLSALVVTATAPAPASASATASAPADVHLTAAAHGHYDKTTDCDRHLCGGNVVFAGTFLVDGVAIDDVARFDFLGTPSEAWTGSIVGAHLVGTCSLDERYYTGYVNTIPCDIAFGDGPTQPFTFVTMPGGWEDGDPTDPHTYLFGGDFFGVYG